MTIQQLGSATGTVGLSPPGQSAAHSPATVSTEERVASTPTVKNQQSPTASLDQVQQAVQKVAAAVQSKANNLQFSIDQDTGSTIVKVVDSQTEEVIRQIPSEEMLAIAQSIDNAVGLLLKQKA